MANYCTKDQAAAMCGKDPDAIAQDWLDWVDAKIEEHTGYGFKGASRIMTLRGDGNSLIRLPSRAAAVTSITEDGVLVDPSDYLHDTDTRFVERIINNTLTLLYSTSSAGRWLVGKRYVVTYTEPTVAPAQYAVTAAQCVAIIALWVDKQAKFGIALTASDNGAAGHMQSAEANSFPASLLEEIGRTIQRGVRKTGL